MQAPGQRLLLEVAANDWRELVLLWGMSEDTHVALAADGRTEMVDLGDGRRWVPITGDREVPHEVRGGRIRRLRHRIDDDRMRGLIREGRELAEEECRRAARRLPDQVLWVSWGGGELHHGVGQRLGDGVRRRLRGKRPPLPPPPPVVPAPALGAPRPPPGGDGGAALVLAGGDGRIAGGAGGK